MVSKAEKFQRAIQKIDQENQQDPNKERWDGQEFPKELLYSQRMTEWLQKFKPESSEALQLATRSQHICRWTIPRDSYPMDRKGYLQWRTELKGFHASKAEEILQSVGYDQELIDRVKSLILKKRMKIDAESQTLEDVVCLVFLEHYFSDFAQKHQEDKVISILQKTWKKMSQEAREVALSQEYPKTDLELIKKALG